MHPNLELRVELDDIRQSIIYRDVIVKMDPFNTLAVQMLLAGMLEYFASQIIIYFNFP